MSEEPNYEKLTKASLVTIIHELETRADKSEALLELLEREIEDAQGKRPGLWLGVVLFFMCLTPWVILGLNSLD
jgi:hypothetical protein